MILKSAVLATVSSRGFGTYFGFTFVFLRSRPTSDVPRGTMTPPLILLNLYKILSSCVKSNTEVKFNDKVSVASDCAPFDPDPSGAIAFAEPPTSLIPNPGLLSVSYTHLTLPTICSV